MNVMSQFEFDVCKNAMWDLIDLIQLQRKRLDEPSSTTHTDTLLQVSFTKKLLALSNAFTLFLLFPCSKTHI